MTASSVRGEIARLVTDLLDKRLALLGGTPVLRTEAASQYVVTWATGAESLRRGVPPGTPFGNMGEYIWLLGTGNYTCLLYDGALLQLAFTFKRADIIRHRLCYYPCPLESEHKFVDPETDIVAELLTALEREADRLGLEDAEALVMEPLEDAWLRLRSPMRFDFYLHEEGRNHSRCHVHIGDNECRVPVFGPLSVGDFVRFVFRNFYPAIWEEHEFLQTWPLGIGTRTIGDTEELQVHFNCRREL